MRDEFVEKVYETLQGNHSLESGVLGVENLFTDTGPGLKLYCQMWEAYERLCQRLDLQETEDADVEIIINSLMDIADLLSFKMYEYGAIFGSSRHK